MKKRSKPLLITGLLGFTALFFAANPAANAQSRYGKTNHFGKNVYQTQYNSPYIGYPHAGRTTGSTRYIQNNPYNGYAPQPPKKYKNIVHRIQNRKALPYQIPAPLPTPGNTFQSWVNYEPHYTFYPGDQLDIVVSSAPELSRSITVGPDGRISMPMVPPFMAAGRTLGHIQNTIRTHLATQLRDPTLTVTPRAFAPAQVFVGGNVNQPGTYTLPGPVGVIETIFMAGGFRAGAKSKQVAVLRRAPNGGMMMRPVNIQNGLRNIREYDDNMQLRRGDIVFVPRTTLAELGAFMQAIRTTIPFDFNVSYQFGNTGGGTDPTLLNNGTSTTITP